MNDRVTVELLCEHTEVLPTLAQWFEDEWPSWYGDGGHGNAAADLRHYASAEGLPRGLVAFEEEQVCGVAVLKSDSIASHAHLSPWAAAALVERSKRGRGIGARLITALECEACALGYDRIFCGTSTARSLLQRCGWELLEDISHEGEALGIFSKALEPADGAQLQSR